MRTQTDRLAGRQTDRPRQRLQMRKCVDIVKYSNLLLTYVNFCTRLNGIKFQPKHFV